MAKTSAIKIKNVIGGGAVEGGQAIYFNVLFDGGETETYVCDMSLLPLVMGNLTAYANIAEGVRFKGDGRTLAMGAPYLVEKVDRSAHTTDGKRVVVEFATNHGFPVQIAMTPEQAAQTIEFLQREILLLKSDEPNKRH